MLWTGERLFVVQNLTKEEGLLGIFRSSDFLWWRRDVTAELFGTPLRRPREPGEA